MPLDKIQLKANKIDLSTKIYMIERNLECVSFIN